MKLLRRIRYWIQSRRADSELAEEIEFHRALKQEEFERSGLSSKDAAAASRRELGNSLCAREESRDVWGWTWLQDAVRDGAYACRTLRKMPGLAVVVIASLGVGIGVNTAVFSWIQAVVLQPIPGVENSSAFYLVEPRAETGSYPGASWPEYDDLRQRLTSFQNLIAFRMAPFNVGEADRIERKYGLLVSDNYFSGLGLKPALGHFPEGDDASERKPVVVISHGFWKAKFNGESNALGQTIRVNDQVLTIVAVAPEDFQGTVLALDFDLWIPSTLASALFPGSRELDDRGERGYALIGNLQTGATAAQAQTELNGAMRQLSQSYPAVSGKFEAELLPYWSAPRGPQRFIVSSLAILQGVTILLLMAVCGNTANLLLARAVARGREIGTRLAIGATRWRVVRLLMTESLLLGLLGAALGVAIAIWGTQALRAVPLPTFLPIRFQTRVDLMGLAVSVFLGMSCALAFGLAPALQLVRRDPQSQLRSNFSTASRKRLPRALMAVEAALALMVLLAAGLFFESFRDTKTVDPGFQIEGVLLAAYDLTGGAAGHLQMNRTIDPAFSRDFADRVLKRLRELPDVESAAIAAFVPLDIHGLPMRSFDVKGRSRTDGSPDRSLINFVTPDYFHTMRIPQLAGVDFTALDDRTTVPQIIVNQEFIRRYVPGLEPIGRRLQYGKDSFVIAGVVKDSFYDSFGEAPIPIMYFSYRDRPRSAGEIHLKTRAGTETLVAGEVQRVVREIEPGIPIFNVRTLADHVETNSFFRRIPSRLFTVLGPLLLLFAAIGIYSVVDNNVTHRITEIGVRLAVGATPRDVVTQVVGETLKVIGVGILAGVLVALIVYIHLVPGGPIDPRVFLGIPAILLFVAATACWLPARRTASVDPMIALRQE
ncbi:MAG TPA: ABC transporter permease [Terriglobia bacterium]|nr:ABC transporter permease [Terriglobia bacterium]